LAHALDLASLLIVMITPAAVASRNVRNEINTALSWGKPLLAIHLIKAVLLRGMELQIGSLQAIVRWPHR
jgi:hypothetical protein